VDEAIGTHNSAALEERAVRAERERDAQAQIAAAAERARIALPGQPGGRGKVERYMDTINQMCLAALPGYAPRGTRHRATSPRWAWPS
jgi:hypothetical protein